MKCTFDRYKDVVCAESGKFYARLYISDTQQRISLGSYDTAEEAATAHAKAYLQHYGCLPGDEARIDLSRFRINSASGYKGVTVLSTGRYLAKLWMSPRDGAERGKEKYIGMFRYVEEAARAYARAYIEEHGGPPGSESDAAVARPQRDEDAIAEEAPVKAFPTKPLVCSSCRQSWGTRKAFCDCGAVNEWDKCLHEPIVDKAPAEKIKKTSLYFLPDVAMGPRVRSKSEVFA